MEKGERKLKLVARVSNEEAMVLQILYVNSVENDIWVFLMLLRVQVLCMASKVIMLEDVRILYSGMQQII